MTRAARPPMVPVAVDNVGGAEVLGVSERTFYLLRRSPGFPRARALTPTISRFIVAELVEWLAAQPAAELASEPPQLVGRKFRSGQPIGERA